MEFSIIHFVEVFMDNTTLIKIRNCNCIRSTEIRIKGHCLNIKFGINGTGKSTISMAIRAKAENDSDLLRSLLPYGNDLNQPDQCPEVIDMPYTTIRVFDDTYANKYLFRGNEFFDNSFKVFLQSSECEQLEAETDNMLEELQGAFQKSPELDQLRSLLPQFFASIKYNNGKISKTGGMGEFLKGNGCGFEKQQELSPYQNYYSQEDFSKVTGWAKWRRDGIGHMNGDSCPFCASDMEMPKINKQNTLFETVFKNSAINTATAVLEYLKKAVGQNFITPEEVNVLQSYMGDSSKSNALITELSQLAVETHYLNTQINTILNFKPMNVTREEIEKIELRLNEMHIEESLIGKFYCTKLMQETVSEINGKIEKLRGQAQKLKGLFKKYDDKLGNLIDNRKNDINHFLAIAGFPYEFVILPDGNGKAKTYLVSIDSNSHAVPNPEKRLSWGEKNAFSLVMFMTQAISDEADLIVLDDPISSFDENKKFAVIRRLFDNQKNSLKNKTVLMLTHDTQPLIDFVKGDFFKRYGLKTDVNVMFLENASGNVTEREIYKEDLKNVVDQTLSIAKDENETSVVRIVNLRKYIELTFTDPYNSPEYHILSNIIHGESKPKYLDDEEIEDSIISIGCDNIAKYIADFNYRDYIDRFEDSKLLQYYKTAEPYEQMLFARFLFERKNSLTQLRRKYPALCKFLNETNHIENDYVFQLDPRKFLKIPQCYQSQLDDFIENFIA